MLEGIHPLLSGELLHHLDDMGHSDAVVIADAHSPALDLRTSADGTVLEVQRELMDAAGTTPETTAFIDRFAYYDVARAAFLVIRTGETRTYGNAVLRKGVVGQPRP